MLFDESAAKTAEPTRISSIGAIWQESDPFLEMKTIGQWPWPWKGQIPPFYATFKILTRIFLEAVRDREKVSIEVKYEVMAFERWKHFWPQVTFKGQRSRSNPKNLCSQISQKRYKIEKMSI